MDFIARTHPKCKQLAYGIAERIEELPLILEQLFVAEHYRNMIPIIRDETDECRLEKQLDNFDYKTNGNLFWLNQAANRIESNPDIFELYNHMTPDFLLIVENTAVSEFREMRKMKMAG
jgi:hypothetical protein